MQYVKPSCAERKNPCRFQQIMTTPQDRATWSTVTQQTVSKTSLKLQPNREQIPMKLDMLIDIVPGQKGLTFGHSLTRKWSAKTGKIFHRTFGLTLQCRHRSNEYTTRYNDSKINVFGSFTVYEELTGKDR